MTSADFVPKLSFPQIWGFSPKNTPCLSDVALAGIVMVQYKSISMKYTLSKRLILYLDIDWMTEMGRAWFGVLIFDFRFSIFDFRFFFLIFFDHSIHWYYCCCWLSDRSGHLEIFWKCFDFEFFFLGHTNNQIIKLCPHAFKFRGSTFNVILVFAVLKIIALQCYLR